MENAKSEEVEIKKGVRQGCVLSVLLFSVYSEAIFKSALKEEDGVKVGKIRIFSIRLISDSGNGLQNIQ